MIERYSSSKLREIWSDQTKWTLALQVELAWLSVLEERSNTIPVGTSFSIRNKNIKIDLDRIEELERISKHDVIAFLSSIEEQCGEEGRYLHYGLTSSDILDTVMALRIKESYKEIEPKLYSLVQITDKLAKQYINTPILGRTHGMPAETMSLGAMFASWREALKRSKSRFDVAVQDCLIGKLSGAVGNHVLSSPDLEETTLGFLGLKPEPVATQIVARDRLAWLISTAAVCGGVLEKIATDIRHRQILGELQEGFAKGQKGSSAMPHKKNPIACENICGQARLLRSYSIAAMEDQVLWMERDISHSSVERVILPDCLAGFDYALDRLKGVLENLVVKEAKLLDNIKSNITESQLALHEMIDRGVSRQKAYEYIQHTDIGNTSTKGIEKGLKWAETIINRG